MATPEHARPRYQAFLSHSSADKPAVGQLARPLEREGVSVWPDKGNLTPGNPWQDEIEAALDACARGLGANVIATEVKPTAALKATLDGFRTMPMDEAAKIGDVFITATGCKDVIVGRHFDVMKDGAIVCNTGHYDCEINIPDLDERAVSSRVIRENCREVTMADGRRIYLLAEGRLVNLAAAEGHPSEVMDMSFANQFQGMMMLAKEGKDLAIAVHELPEELDQEIAGIKLETLGLGLDVLTPEQVAYMNSWSEGT